jgi:DNA-binding IclR family transcriptional regulator
LALASAIWFKAGISSTKTNIVVGEQLAKQFGVHRGARYRALDELQAAGLISVDQKPGSAPRVSLITKLKQPKRKTPTTWSQAI